MNPVRAMFVAVDQAFAEGTDAVGFLLRLSPVVVAGDGQFFDFVPIVGRASLTAREITIADVPPGTYVGTVALVDANDVELAPAVADPSPITIADALPVSFPVPSSLSLTRP